MKRGTLTPITIPASGQTLRAEPKMTLEEALAHIEKQNAAIEAANASNESMKAKMDELLGEAKSAKNAKRDAEAAAQAKIDAAALASGDHKQLLESSQLKLTETEKALNELKQGIAGEKVESQALKIATELADGHNAVLLSRFIKDRIAHTDEGLKVTNSNGELTISSFDELRTEFSNNKDFDSLLRGTSAAGGGAPGGKGSASDQKEISRSDFDSKSQGERAAFAKDGGKVIDD